MKSGEKELLSRGSLIQLGALVALATTADERDAFKELQSEEGRRFLGVSRKTASRRSFVKLTPLKLTLLAEEALLSKRRLCAKLALQWAKSLLVKLVVRAYLEQQPLLHGYSCSHIIGQWVASGWASSWGGRGGAWG